MSPLSVTFFTVAFVTVSMYFAETYEKLHLGQQTWMIIAGITVAVFVGNLLYESFFKKEKQED
jgi:uncharacterized membrane protein